MEYKFTRGIQRPNAAQLSLALSPVLHDPLVTDPQRGVAGANVYQESPKMSRLAVPAKTPYSVLSSGSIYSQDSWDGPEAWAFNKPPPSSKLAGPVLLAVNNSSPQRDSTISSSTDFRSFGSVHSDLSSSQMSSITSYSGQTTLTSIESTMENEENKKEKKAKLKQMYKRASMSTKALAKMFSRSPKSGRGSPNGGVTKRSSLKAPLPIQVTSPPKDLLNLDPFASGSSASSNGISPPEVKHLPRTHKRAGSSTNVKTQIPVDVQKQLRRSPSVSSPLGMPTLPLLTRSPSQSQQPGVRGRDTPFPVNLSNVSLPLQGQRVRSSSQSSATSTGTQVAISRAQNQTQPPIPRIPSSASLRAQARQTPPNPAPEQPPPDVPFPQPVPGPVPVDTPRHTSNFVQRPRSKSVREAQRPRPTLATTENSPQRPEKKHSMPYDNKLGVIDHEKPSFLDMPPSDRARHLVQGLVEPNAKYASVHTHEVHVVAPSPSMPAMRAAFLDSAPPNPGDTFKRRPRAGSTTAESVRRDSDSSSRIDSRTPENPKNSGKGLELDGLPERIPQHRMKNNKPSRDPSPARAPTQLAASQKNPLPLLVTQNLPSADDSEPKASSLRTQGSIWRIPHSPSMPSLRPDITNTPPLLPNASSHREGSNSRFGTSHNPHIRSPSLPNFPSNTIPSSTSSLDKERRQPLPSSITERLRTRARSNSRSEERPPHVHSSSRPPSIPNEMKKPLEPIPSASTDSSTYSSPHPSGPMTSSLQTPPPPRVSHLLRARAANRPQERNLRSPSMPDLRINSSNASSRSRRPCSPPPPLPSALRQPTLEPDPNIVRLQEPAISVSSGDTKERILGRPKSSSPVPTAFLRPGINLTRPKELSYPMTKITSRAFHARSNKELAKEGDWDFLDAPPRPPRSPLAQVPHNPVNKNPSYVVSRSRSNSVKGAHPSVPVTQVRKKHSGERMIGMAL